MPDRSRPRKLSLALLLRYACPSCGGEDVRRAHRRTWFDWALSALGPRPYRCSKCQRRFHAVPALRSLAFTSKDRHALALRRQAGSGGIAG
jgi:ribosomal protein L37AE/L43A